MLGFQHVAARTGALNIASVKIARKKNIPDPSMLPHARPLFSGL